MSRRKPTFLDLVRDEQAALSEARQKAQEEEAAVKKRAETAQKLGFAEMFEPTWALLCNVTPRVESRSYELTVTWTLPPPPPTPSPVPAEKQGETPNASYLFNQKVPNLTVHHLKSITLRLRPVYGADKEPCWHVPELRRCFREDNRLSAFGDFGKHPLFLCAMKAIMDKGDELAREAVAQAKEKVIELDSKIAALEAQLLTIPTPLTAITLAIMEK
jgi:hypothetical protein